MRSRPSSPANAGSFTRSSTHSRTRWSPATGANRTGLLSVLAEQVRSGLVETSHTGAVAIVGPDGSLIAGFGDIDRPFYIRSSAKPFQASVSQEYGAAMSPLEMAMACASHRGFPVQIAIVSSMLEKAGLDHSALRCPPSFPLAEEARHRVIRGGADERTRVWHNCSGKHAGFLRACVASGWPVDSYLSPDNPLQERVTKYIGELSEYPVEPVGVDGCGAPVMRTTVRAMALMYARLATDEHLEAAFRTMHQYPALVGANGSGDTEIAMATGGAAKGGAAGCIGVALEDRLGLAVKSWDGLSTVANIAAVSALDQLGELTPTAKATLEPIARPRVLGGGEPVGTFESRLRLEMS